MNLMPMCVSNLADDRHQEGEGEVLVTLEDGEEVIVLEEAHGPVCNLKVWSCDTFDQSLEEFWDEGFEFGDLAHLQHFKELVEEHDLLGRVGEGPIAQQTFHEKGGKCWVLREEEH